MNKRSCTHTKGHNIGSLFSNGFFKSVCMCTLCIYTYLWAPLVAQMVKNLPAMQEIQVQSLGQEVPLERGMATHSSILAWRIPWTAEPGGPRSMGSQRVGHD